MLGTALIVLMTKVGLEAHALHAQTEACGRGGAYARFHVWVAAGVLHQAKKTGYSGQMMLTLAGEI